MHPSPFNKQSVRSLFRKKNKRKRIKAKRRKGFFRYFFAVIKTANSKGIVLSKDDLPKFRIFQPQQNTEPDYSDNIKFLARNPDLLSRQNAMIPSDGVFLVPERFSFTENYEESFIFLKKLFFALYNKAFTDLVIDYKNCQSIDLDACVCMDVLLGEFIDYVKRCRINRYACGINSIKPINFHREELIKILFSVGTFSNIRGMHIKHPDILPFPLIKGNNFSHRSSGDTEIEVTNMVDYIERCLNQMNRALTPNAGKELSEVIGEVLINAREHSGRQYRYAIGYFEKHKDGSSTIIGTFNLVIFSFGNTIYQNFTKLESLDLQVVKRMQELSDSYTKRNFFNPRAFEEETLWTLYSLQEGVTSVPDKKRGNGSIRFIENFFSLKGDMENDNFSSLMLMSGNSRIKFDGTYKVVEKIRGKDENLYKMITFNESGNIEDPPDKNFVTFAKNFFPGTMISAKININFNNVEKEVENGSTKY